MHRVITIFFGLLAVCLIQASDVRAWFWEDTSLVKINGEQFTQDDFESWWKNWQEKGVSFPASPSEFIDWHLLAREAQEMELYYEPVYRKKVDTFLRARSLMLFKQEKIDGKINITDEILYAKYAEEYCPRWHLELVYFDDSESARKILDTIEAGNLPFEQLTGEDEKVEGRRFLGKKWFRRNLLPEGWYEVLENLPVDKVSGPHSMGKGFVLFRMLETAGPDQDDFAVVKDGVRKKEWDNQQADLTRQLLYQLKKQYQVEVDEELLAFLQLDDAPDGEAAEKILIKTSVWQVQVRDFLELLSKEEAFRHSSGFYKGESFENLKQRVLGNLLSQSLTSVAALDRHFENEPPFKQIFQFYSQHRLIKELERKLFVAENDPDEAKIEKYYQDNIDQFSKPAVVNIAVLEDDARLGEKIWEEVSRGDDFFAVAARYYSRHPAVQEIPVAHLEPTVMKVVQELAVGEVSRPFTVQEHSALVKLVSRRGAEAIPLDHVRDEIVRQVRRAEYTQKKQDYLDALRKRSNIEVNNKVWEKITKQFGGGNSAK